jgi:hypothetical protein
LANTTGRAPSSIAKSAEYRENQSGEDAILDGRQALNTAVNTIAPPIQLFNPAFAYFSSKAFDPNYNVPPEFNPQFIPDVVDFMAQSATLYGSESNRKDHLKRRLEKVLGRTIDIAENRDGSCADFGVTCTIDLHKAYLVVGEEKKELGDGSSDPSTQAGLSYWHIFRQNDVKTLPLYTISFAVADGCNT